MMAVLHRLIGRKSIKPNKPLDRRVQISVNKILLVFRSLSRYFYIQRLESKFYIWSEFLDQTCYDQWRRTIKATCRSNERINHIRNQMDHSILRHNRIELDHQCIIDENQWRNRERSCILHETFNSNVQLCQRGKSLLPVIDVEEEMSRAIGIG